MRLFLRATRRDVEVRHYAQLLFLRRDSFKTRARHGVLILVSTFERQGEIVADSGLHGGVGEPDWRSLIANDAGAGVAADCRGAAKPDLARGAAGGERLSR